MLTVIASKVVIVGQRVSGCRRSRQLLRREDPVSDKRHLDSAPDGQLAVRKKSRLDRGLAELNIWVVGMKENIALLQNGVRFEEELFLLLIVVHEAEGEMPKSSLLLSNHERVDAETVCFMIDCKI